MTETTAGLTRRMRSGSRSPCARVTRFAVKRKKRASDRVKIRFSICLSQIVDEARRRARQKGFSERLISACWGNNALLVRRAGVKRRLCREASRMAEIPATPTISQTGAEE